MRAVLVDVPQEMLDDRRRKGLDVFDEVWEGVLHMVPAPSSRHQRVGTELLVVLHPLAASRGLQATYETGLYRPAAGQRDYRVPDLVVAAADHFGERGVEGPPELVVELRSPDDETYEKLGFYAEVGVKELLVIDLDRPAVEVFRHSGEDLSPLAASGPLPLSSVGLSVALVETSTLQLSWDSGTADIAL